ncbi:pheromone response protein [Aspergillus tubingensis]|uniref:pheromone response protein n=1 Tax=Aspergillus tubingensis TaxID=5068 RepID=UPI0015791819|nr:pheromone response protein [Aspergillus tubingensis]GFN17962.1 pheromone response protein [Aspergillus tubingensis]
MTTLRGKLSCVVNAANTERYDVKLAQIYQATRDLQAAIERALVEEVLSRTNRVVIAAVRGGGAASVKLQSLSVFVTVDRIEITLPQWLLNSSKQLQSLLQDTKTGYDEAFHRRRPESSLVRDTPKAALNYLV